MSEGNHGVIITRTSLGYACSAFDDEDVFDSVISYLNSPEGRQLDFETIFYAKVPQRYSLAFCEKADELSARATKGEDIDLKSHLEKFCMELCR